MGPMSFEGALSASLGAGNSAQADAESMMKSLTRSDDVAMNRMINEAEQAQAEYDADTKKKIDRGNKTQLRVDDTATMDLQKTGVDTTAILQKFLDTPTMLSIDMSGGQ